MDPPRGATPILGALVCTTLFVLRVSSGDLRATLIAGTLLAGAAVLYVAIKPHIGTVAERSI